MTQGRNVLAKTYDDDEQETTVTQSGIFPTGQRCVRQTSDRRRDGEATLAWLERRFARMHAGDAVLVRLAKDHDTY